MIKNYIYLDNEKMFSLSSQIFEGVTEYVLQESSIEKDETDSQKGPVGSGKVIADVMRESNRNSEKKYLHDYSMTVFEKHLVDSGSVLDINESTDKNQILEEINDATFVRVKAKAKIVDYVELQELMENFMTLSRAMVNLTAPEELREMENTVALIKNKKKSRTAEENDLIKSLEGLSVIDYMAKTIAGGLTPLQASSFVEIMKFSFQEQLTLTQDISGIRVTTHLNRFFMKEDVRHTLLKYARKTPKEIVVIGVVSQGLDHVLPETDPPGMDYDNMRSAVDNLAEHLHEMDFAFGAKSENEVIIDPIAVYFEL